jgi:putative FmdB family regulatory protein
VPIYEYRCRACRRRVQVLTLRATEAPDATCPSCGGTRLDRLPSRFSLPRSAGARLDALAESAAAADLDGDPRSAARWMREVGSALGEEVGADGGDEIAREIEAAVDEPSSSED